MQLSAKIADKILKLINKYGTACTLSVRPVTTYDATQSTPGTGSNPITQDIMCIIDTFPNRLRPWGDQLAQPTSIAKGDVQFTFAYNKLTNLPKIGDKINIKSSAVLFEIINLTPVYVQEQIVMYVVHGSKI